ncbi:hypothetical protein GCM10023085_08300 [Actinomadura viridis]|uniref:Uncharacterized protein n=1 Tax=Actinomadura viridis TaxID=58110 RepID=A0A931DQB8_9ACTN|nr:hypothetical protein [Actinomadura viridis]MBG6091841.1 hypothetical protein [Actinomadura viridis]
MHFGRDLELERAGTAVRSLELGGHDDDHGRSRARVYLCRNGDVTLYCTDSGWAVRMQIGEMVTEWRRWTTVAAADVPRLAAETGETVDVLDAVRASVGTVDDDAAHKIEGRFSAWLRERDIPYTFRQFDEYD